MCSNIIFSQISHDWEETYLEKNLYKNTQTNMYKKALNF